ncbi:nicotianamine synthase family protein [Sorangium cellulosum]|uniref:Nicotianamine synthase n=1 Tax=Sorangium cellulosum TaxID=56 RepID=A0A150QAY3_SORCE|nr:nicotianamine synthase family protein [Sorangium cellulosum]KYF65154.1 nicotianamine synthase [Sorangium cellulosum]
MNTVIDPSLSTRIHRIYNELASMGSLAPSQRVNHLFSELVSISMSRSRGEADEVLGDPAVSAIREGLWRVCSRGEYELERHWARRIAAADDPAAELRSFPYAANYDKLTRLELSGLRGVRDELPRRVLFIGSGPLPFTSILLAERLGLPVSNIDVDEEACADARALARRLGLSDRLGFTCADALACADLSEFDCVFLAALVGMNRREKSRLLHHLHGAMRPGALLLVRSSQRLRTLLYPEVDIHGMAPFEPLLEIHPHDEVINSVILAERPGPDRIAG